MRSPLTRFLIETLKCTYQPSRLNIKQIRAFSSTRCSASTNPRRFFDNEYKHVKINRDRLWKGLHDTCEWGKGERWGDEPTDVGMSRLTLSDADKQARDWFVNTTRELGCRVTIDAMGNVFAVRPGKSNWEPPTYAGSHLDTQPSGGRYDGILGVHAGIEALRTMNENNIETEYPTGVINWTNEEGARFPVSMLASGVWAGEIPLEKAHSLKEVGDGNATLKSELERIGYLGSVDSSYEDNPIGAHFELHIEQGPILESTSGKIGVVEGVQAYSWHTITIRGQDCHTGSTDFKNRSDALLTAAKMIIHSHNKASKMGCLASTGILTLKPGSTNTVPGLVQFSLDLRSKSDGHLETLESALRTAFDNIADGATLPGLSVQLGTKGKGCTVEWQVDSVSPKTRFNPHCIQCVEDSAYDVLKEEIFEAKKAKLEEEGETVENIEFGVRVKESSNLVQRMTSGAGHDSVYTSRHAPTAMIFVPCRGGVSHNPAEYCSQEDCGNGAQVLLGAMLRMDRLRAKWARNED